MTLERRYGAILCAVGILLLLVATGPLGNTRQVLALWCLTLLGAAVAIGAGCLLIATGKAADGDAS